MLCASFDELLLFHRNDCVFEMSEERREKAGAVRGIIEVLVLHREYEIAQAVSAVDLAQELKLLLFGSFGERHPQDVPLVLDALWFGEQIVVSLPCLTIHSNATELGLILEHRSGKGIGEEQGAVLEFETVQTHLIPEETFVG